ncbi:MAG: protein kinase [Chloroflexi bacterium]|nr:protein kinase [Chloroflexota bacterium]MCL5274533.1 protein kinase [Chloroflexota bacterium]
MPYKNLVEIGHGGMATIYRATAPNGNLVVLKVLAMHLANDKTALARFKQETNLGLIHPNIVRVMDGGVENGAPYIVMDYVVGESLDRRLLRVGTLKPQQLAPILKDVANALEYANTKEIVHRDVKPSNILIRPTGQALLVDFGVAKTMGATAYTATTARVGSVFYMSPEQANGEPVITHASDIYSLGVTAYFALTGRHPFEAENEIAIARMHIDAKPRHVSEINPAVPRIVGNVVMQALEKDPQHRPRTAGEFAEAFAQAIAKAGRSPSRPNRARVLLVAAAGLAMLGVTALALFRSLPEQSVSVDLTSLPPVQLSATPQSVSGQALVPAIQTPSVTPSPTDTPTAVPTEADTATPTPTDTPESTQTPVIIIRYKTKVVTAAPTRAQPRWTPSPKPIKTPTPPVSATDEEPTATTEPSATSATPGVTASATAPSPSAMPKTPVPTTAVPTAQKSATPQPTASATPMPTATTKSAAAGSAPAAPTLSPTPTPTPTMTPVIKAR